MRQALAIAAIIAAPAGHADTQYFNPGDFHLRCTFVDECNIGTPCRGARAILTMEHREVDGPLAKLTYGERKDTAAQVLSHYALTSEEDFAIILSGDPGVNVQGDAMIHVTITSNLQAFYTSHAVHLGARASITRNGQCENLSVVGS